MLKSGEKGLVCPGSNDCGRKELTNELADKIWNSVQKKIDEDKIAKEKVLHHLKQLKAQMGKLKSKDARWMHVESAYNAALLKCVEMIDDKIAKINKGV